MNKVLVLRITMEIVKFARFIENSNFTNIMNDTKVMNLAADNIRILAASMVEKAKS